METPKEHSKSSLQDSMLHALSHLPVPTSINRLMKSARNTRDPHRMGMEDVVYELLGMSIDQ